MVEVEVREFDRRREEDEEDLGTGMEDRVRLVVGRGGDSPKKPRSEDEAPLDLASYSTQGEE